MEARLEKLEESVAEIPILRKQIADLTTSVMSIGEQMKIMRSKLQILLTSTTQTPNNTPNPETPTPNLSSSSTNTQSNNLSINQTSLPINTENKPKSSSVTIIQPNAIFTNTIPTFKNPQNFMTSTKSIITQKLPTQQTQYSVETILLTKCVITKKETNTQKERGMNTDVALQDFRVERMVDCLGMRQNNITEEDSGKRKMTGNPWAGKGARQKEIRKFNVGPILISGEPLILSSQWVLFDPGIESDGVSMDTKPTNIGSSMMFRGYNKLYKQYSFTLGYSMTFHFYFPPPSSSHKFHVPCWLSGLACTNENFIIKSEAQLVASTVGVAIIAYVTSLRGLNVEREAYTLDLGVGVGEQLDGGDQIFEIFDNQCHLCLDLVRHVFFFSQMDDQQLDAKCECMVFCLSSNGTSIIHERETSQSSTLRTRWFFMSGVLIRSQKIAQAPLQRKSNLSLCMFWGIFYVRIVGDLLWICYTFVVVFAELAELVTPPAY